jgi:hypothetical protein
VGQGRRQRWEGWARAGPGAMKGVLGVGLRLGRGIGSVAAAACSSSSMSSGSRPQLEHDNGDTAAPDNLAGVNLLGGRIHLHFRI